MPKPLDLSTLNMSTTYPPVPSIEDLEVLKQTLTDRRIRVTEKLKEVAPDEYDRYRNERKVRKQMRMQEANNAASSSAVRDRDRDRDREGSVRDEEVRVKRERQSELASPSPPNASAQSARSNGQPVTYSSSHNKKKKKRIQDSDDERPSHSTATATASAARGTPTSPPHHQSSLKVRLPHGSSSSIPPKSRPTPSSSAVASGSAFTGADEQALPIPASAASASIGWAPPPLASRPLVPLRPGVHKPPKPGPKKQSEVDEDFSNTKAPSTQTQLPHFWTSVEPYLREIREDDLAMLKFKADAPEVMDIPPRGRHYTEIWDEEDSAPPGTTPRMDVPNLKSILGELPTPIPPTSKGSASAQAAAAAAASLPPPYNPTELSELALVDEMRGLGNISERLVAALLPDTPQMMEEHKKSVEGRYGEDWEIGTGLTGGGGGGLAAKVNARELEERVKKELRGVGLLGDHEEFDLSKRDDDEITSSLRQCQRLLEAQIAINDQRKARLVSQATNRLAYAEYSSKLDGLEKSIEAAWAKRVKKLGSGKKDSHSKSRDKDKDSGSGSGSGSGARQPITEHLKNLVENRRRWVYGSSRIVKELGPDGQEVEICKDIPGVGQMFKNLPLGKVRGLPEKSIYEGLEDVNGQDAREEEEVMDVLEGE